MFYQIVLPSIFEFPPLTLERWKNLEVLIVNTLLRARFSQEKPIQFLKIFLKKEGF